jgi:hypothetical protein
MSERRILTMSAWREKYKVHPAADVWDMLTDEELNILAEDIKANGLRVPIAYCVDGGEKMIVDGRNRLEAMERAGVEVEAHHFTRISDSDGVEIVSKVIGLNAHRRHLTKEDKAAAIVAAVEAAAKQAEEQAKLNPATGGEKPEDTPKRKPGRPRDPEKAAAVAAGAKQGVSKRRIESARSKRAGKKPAPRKRKPNQKPKKTPKRKKSTEAAGYFEIPEGIEPARDHYLAEFRGLDDEAQRVEASGVADALAKILAGAKTDEAVEEDIAA